MNTFAVDPDFDDLSYMFDMDTRVPDIYRGDIQLWCAVLRQWMFDLTDRDKDIRLEAQSWPCKKRDVQMVCGLIGINPNVIKATMQKVLTTHHPQI